MKFLVTGSAGFIGFHVCHRLLNDGHRVIGFDNLSDYYDINLKQARLAILKKYEYFTFYNNTIEDKNSVDQVFEAESPKRVIHLAAQAGVRYSIDHPDVYGQSNLIGFLNILEGCRQGNVEHLLYASSSSVYGLNESLPFSTSDNVNHPISLYGATKKANELMAHSYSHLYRLPTTGLRFFTVYGPWGRPDMAYFLFIRNIIEGRCIDVYNRGEMERDFTFIDDIVEGVVRVAQKLPEPDKSWSGNTPDPASSSAPYRLYNIGADSPVNLMEFIREIEGCLGITANLNLMPMQPGDVLKTQADVSSLEELVGELPKTAIKDGIRKFVDWYVDFYKVKLPG
ncbi:MAG: NAD-dependent epimerase [Nitrospinales bacterium]